MIIRKLTTNDIERVAVFEKEISVISFQEEAITDLEFYRKKLTKILQKGQEEMLVLEMDNQVVGWLWMSLKTNSVSEENYINFKSFYIAENYRGTDCGEKLLEAGMKYASQSGATKIIGKVHSQNLPMRALYKKFGFLPTHFTMEYNYAPSSKGNGAVR